MPTLNGAVQSAIETKCVKIVILSALDLMDQMNRQQLPQIGMLAACAKAVPNLAPQKRFFLGPLTVQVLPPPITYFYLVSMIRKLTR